MNTRQLLAKYVALLNKHGVDSPEERAFADHWRNEEFDELAKTAQWLKQQLSVPPSPGKDVLLAQLAAAAEVVLTDLDRRIADAPPDAVPVFAGIAELRSVLARLRTGGAT